MKTSMSSTSAIQTFQMQVNGEFTCDFLVVWIKDKHLDRNCSKIGWKGLQWLLWCLIIQSLFEASLLENESMGAWSSRNNSSWTRSGLEGSSRSEWLVCRDVAGFPPLKKAALNERLFAIWSFLNRFFKYCLNLSDYPVQYFQNLITPKPVKKCKQSLSTLFESHQTIRKCCMKSIYSQFFDADHCRSSVGYRHQ